MIAQAREEIRAGSTGRPVASRGRALSARDGRGSAGAQRDRRDRPHEPRAAPLAEAALARRETARLLEPGVRLAEGARGSRQDHARPPSAARRRGGRARRQQQRSRGAARGRGARGGTRGRGLARRADRDRRRLPHPGRAGALGRAARRGGHDEQDARRGLRGGDRPRDRLLLRAPVQLPAGRVRGAAGAARARGGRAAARAPLVDDLGSGSLLDLGDEPTARDALPAAPISCASRATSCSAARRRGSSSAAPSSWSACAGTPLQRALRADKLQLAALEGTLALYLDPRGARREVPVLRMLGEPAEAVPAAPSGWRRWSAARSSPRSRAWAAGAAARGARELRLRGRGGARGAAAAGRASGDRHRPRRPAAARLPDARRCRRSTRSPRPCSRPRVSERRPESVLWDFLRGASMTGAGDRRRPRPLGVARGRAEPGRELAAKPAPTPTRCTACARSRATGSSRRTSPASSATPRPPRLRADGWADVRAPLRRRLLRRDRGSSTPSGRASRPSPTIFGTDFWSWLAEHPDERRRFDRAMAGGKERRGRAPGRAGVADGDVVVDVGGGNGALLGRPPRTRAARDRLRPAGDRARRGSARRADRVRRGQLLRARARRGRLHPPGILHDWDDERAARSSRTIRAAAPVRRRPARRVGRPARERPERREVARPAHARPRSRGASGTRPSGGALLERAGFEPVQHRGRPDRGAMPLTVGTAGHIDHGKTWLVRALTGKDTDRLPEEQRRGSRSTSATRRSTCRTAAGSR